MIKSKVRQCISDLPCQSWRSISNILISSWFKILLSQEGNTNSICCISMETGEEGCKEVSQHKREYNTPETYITSIE